MRALFRASALPALLFLGLCLSAPAQGPAAPSLHPAELPTALVPEDTLLRLRLERSLSSTHAHPGEPVDFTLIQDIDVDGQLAIPRGALVHGRVVYAHHSGVSGGAPVLTLRLDSLDLGGRRYTLYAYQFTVRGISKTAASMAKIEGGAAVGALAGNAMGSPATQTARLENVAAGAAAGDSVGAAAALVTGPPPVELPAESQLDFFLAAPLAVTPADSAERARLGHRIPADEPALYVHSDR